MKCFPPFQSYTKVVKGPGNHSRWAIFHIFTLILVRNMSCTSLNDHYTTSTVLLDAFRSHLVSMKCFPPFHSYTARLGRAWKSLARSYFELFSPYIGQKQEPDHPKWPLYHVYSTCWCTLDHIWCLWSVSHPSKAIQRSWKGMEITHEELFLTFSPINPWGMLFFQKYWVPNFPNCSAEYSQCSRLGL